MSITAFVNRLFGVEKAQARFEQALSRIPSLDEWQRQEYERCIQAIPTAIFWPPHRADRKEKVVNFAIEQIDRAVNLISEDLYWHFQVQIKQLVEVFERSTTHRISDANGQAKLPCRRYRAS